jgi:hypothetical protein
LGRTMARTGLRMMPTFPSSPLKFRTSGFPQYGLKASMSDGAFPECRSVKLTPSIPVQRPGLPPPFVHVLILQPSPIKAGVLDV